MRLQPGTSLQGGRYRIIDVLGQGGFGITYLAEQVMAERKVCIKEFFPKEYYNRDANLRSISLGSQGSAEIMERYKAKFVKEAQTIAHLDHPNIIHILDVFEENNTCYYAMDYIEGESLSERVKRGGAMSERDAVAYIKQVASALEHIHEQQIMHLDVKPGNIMVRSKDDHAILIDFGLSKHYDATSGEATSTTPVGVSHGYAPMEQYQDGGVSTFLPETDIYSLGATLYFLVTGNVPPQTTVVAEQGLPYLDNLSSNIRKAIEISMSYWRKDRPHTIKDFLALLDNDEPIVTVITDESEKTKIAPQTPAPKRESNEDKPKPKKHRWWLWLLIVLLIGGTAYLMFMGGDNAAPISNTTNTAKPQLDTFEHIDSDSTTLNQLRQDSINMAIHDNDIRDSIASVEREQVVRDGTDSANAAAEQKKREEDAHIAEQEKREDEARIAEQKKREDEAARKAKAEQQRIDNMVAQGLGRDGVYQIGDYYNVNGKEGVVFEVSDGGRHGKIVSLDETDRNWSGANTWCRKKGADWYLPAKDELKAIFNSNSKIISTLAKYDAELIRWYYWSSTEKGKFHALVIYMNDGGTSYSNKSNRNSVRAVSAF